MRTVAGSGIKYGLATAALACLLAAHGAHAADGKGIRFWNLTSSTVSKLYLSPAGKDEWGQDYCQSDPDGVDHDERLSLKGVAPGRYDVKLADKSGQTCIVRGVTIEANKVFSVADKDLTDCTK